MTWFLAEAQEAAHEERHGYDEEIVCPCGEAWMVRFFDGAPGDEESMLCDVCGERGEVL